MRIIPLLIIVAVFALGVKITALWTDAQNIETRLFKVAEAADDKENKDKKDEKMAESESDAVIAEEGEAVEEIAEESDFSENEAIPALLRGLSLLEDEGEFDLDFARSEIEVLQNLHERRLELDKREESLERKEAVLKATEQQIEQKISELTSLRDDLKSLLKEQSEEEIKRIQSLVKIYEGMKPGDAANILNSLETDILISVMERMSERRSAPILAEMDPDRAREVTTLLAERKQLPNLDF